MKIISCGGTEVVFRLTEDKEEWFARCAGALGELEYSIDAKLCGNDENWEQLPAFLQYMQAHLKSYVDKAGDPLTRFGKTSGYFMQEEQEYLGFEFGGCVLFLDNAFTLADRWRFELDFAAVSNINGMTIDEGRWLVSFQGNCICGMRREDW